MNNKRKILAAALIGAAGLLAPMAQAGAGGGAMKLEGAWVSIVQDTPTQQWSIVLVPDASGRRASLHGSIDVGLDLSIPLSITVPTYSSPLIGELVMTGPTSAKFKSVWYVLTPGGAGVTATVVLIGVNQGELNFTGPGKGTGTHNITFYLASSDSNPKDGFPDEGTAPIAPSLTFTTNDTRVGAP